MTAGYELSRALFVDKAGDFHRLGELFDEALGQRIFSAASLLLASPEGVLHHSTWGYTSHEDGNAAGKDARFDLASLTKPLITAPLWMRAISLGALSLDDPLSRFIPATLLPAEKKEITVRLLLNHSSGLPPHKPFYLELIGLPQQERRNALLSRILNTPLLDKPGKASHYSDLGFLLLGMILEDAFDSPLERLADEALIGPICQGELNFRPLSTSDDPTSLPSQLSSDDFSYVATERCPWRKRLLRGEVHDENAYTLGGTAGHAGLFGTAFGVYLLLKFLWDLHRDAGQSLGWSSDTVRTFWTRTEVAPNGAWALGFDSPSATGSSAGRYFSRQSIGHLGFTGVSFWLDPEQEILVILLTNRVHPTRENLKIRDFRPLLHNRVMKAYYEFKRH